MTETEVRALLEQVLELLAQDKTPNSFDFEQAFLGLGCTPRTAALLSDYLPAACGRAFLRELGVNTSETYQRRRKDGTWGPPQRFSDDPIWIYVERLAEELRTRSPQSRKRFSLAGQHSAEANTIDNAVNAGKSLEDMRGATCATVFLTVLEDDESLPEQHPGLRVAHIDITEVAGECGPFRWQDVTWRIPKP